MEKTCGNVVNLFQGKNHKDESLANAILLDEQGNLLRWTNPKATTTWEEVFLQQRVNTGLNELLDRVNSPLQFTTRQLDTLGAFLNVAHMSTVESQSTAAHDRRFQKVPRKPCQSDNEERFFGEVDRLFSYQREGKKHQLALVKVFQDVQYADDKDEGYAD
ncbi:hypothetical protein V1522DRAFT_447929 [Lipomyces starkeyi]